jgi:hypothetical protein
MTPRIPSTARLEWRRRIRGLLSERLGLKATALLLATLLWIVVGARQPTEGFVAVRVVPTLDSSLVMLGPPPELRALVAGRTTDLVKLYSSPLTVHRSIGGDAPDTLTLDLTPSDVRVPSELANSIRVVDLQPRHVTLRFAGRATRRVAVVNDGRIRLRTDSGARAAADVEFEPRSVRVTGPRRLVRRMRGIHPHALSIAPGDTRHHVADLDTTGMDVRVQPGRVRVRLRVAGVTAADMDSSADPSEAVGDGTDPGTGVTGDGTKVDTTAPASGRAAAAPLP